jgi:peptidylprolyl isomerase
VRTHRSFFAVLLSAFVMAALAACGSSSTPTPTASHRPAKHAAVAVGGCLMSVTTDLSAEPTVSVPASAACTTPPTKLQIADAIPGHGPAAKAGDSLDVKYVGLHWTNRQPFDASWNNGPTNTFNVSSLGTASVIDGWNQGLIGARAGDRRILAIPASLAYKAAGSGTTIGPNEALIFVIDVVTVAPGGSASPTG